LSFSINTNTAANQALNSLSMTNMSLASSEQRLSTGLKINSGADNPAGLIQANEFSTQITGLNQAITNGQEGTDLTKTADGALSQVNTLLNSAYTLAVASANSATLSTSELQANQQQLNSIVSSINTIAANTTYGDKNLLNGSSGVQSAVTAGSTLSSLNIGGTFGGVALSANATVTLNSVTAATQATDTSAAFATTSTKVTNTGSFTINGTTFSANSNTTAGDLINSINQASTQTGVVASFQSGAIQLTSTAYGTGGVINLVDSSGVIRSGGAGSDAKTGTNAVASVTVGSTTALFTGSVNGASGLTLTDADGNTLNLTVGGNTTTSTAAAVGQVVVGSAQFQIGADAGQTASLSIGNFAASNLGQGAVSGLNLSNLDLTTQSGASEAMQVIDKAISDVSTARGAIGNFQSNVLQVAINNNTTAQQNLTSSLSTVQDTNIAQEMTNFSSLQILQQSGISVLSQANQGAQNLLSLIKAG
jgi:flagellin